MYENAVIKSDYNMRPYFLIQNGTGDWLNVSKHEGKPYALQAKIRFFCQDGFETVNQNDDFNITCSDIGVWSPQLIGCIGESGRNLHVAKCRIINGLGISLKLIKIFCLLFKVIPQKSC